MHVLEVEGRVVGRYYDFNHACCMAVRHVLRRKDDRVTVWRTKNGKRTAIVYFVYYEDGKLADCFPEAVVI